MIDWAGRLMNDRIREAYYEHCLALARAGVVDDSMNDAIVDGKTVNEHMVDVLRAAGKLPVEDREGATPRGTPRRSGSCDGSSGDQQQVPATRKRD